MHDLIILANLTLVGDLGLFSDLAHLEMTFTTYPRQNEKIDYDVIVIGAGIMGSCTAYQLAKKGKKVLLLEQFSYGHKKGSSHGASRIIRYAHTEAIYMPLADGAYREWDELARLTGMKLYDPCGLLWIGDEKGNQTRADLLKKYGVNHKVYHGKEIGQNFPHLKYGEEWHAVLDTKAGVIFADKCIEAAQRQFGAYGGKIHFSETVLSIKPTAGDIIEIYTNTDKYTCRSLVVTAGAWLNQLFPELETRTEPTLVGMNFWKITSNYELFKPENKSPVMIITELDDEMFSIPNVDHPGMIKFGVHAGVPLDMVNPNRPEPPRWTYTIPAKHIKEHLNFIDASEPLIKETCVYTVTDDQDFIIDRHPVYRNVIIGGGFSGTGFKFGSIVGEILAKMAVNEDVSEFDLKPFSASRKVDPFHKAKL